MTVLIFNFNPFWYAMLISRRDMYG